MRSFSAAVDIKTALREMIAGTIGHHFDYGSELRFLASIAATTFSMPRVFMPETRQNLS